MSILSWLEKLSPLVNVINQLTYAYSGGTRISVYVDKIKSKNILNMLINNKLTIKNK